MWVEPQKKKLDDGTEIITGYKYVKRYYNIKLGKDRTVSRTYKVNSPQARNKAEAHLNKRIAEINSSQSDKKLTLGEAYKAYYDYKLPRWSTSTEQTARSMYDNHIANEKINDYLLDKITTADVRFVVDKMQLTKGLSESMTKKVRGLIKAIMLFAKDEYGIQHNVNFSRVHFKKDPKKLKLDYIESTILKEEIEKMHQLIGGRYALFLETQILTGMRFGELAAITEKDWNGEYIIIDKAVETSNKRAIGATKNYHSTRVIQSSKRVNEIFKQLIAENKARFKDKSSLIFANEKNRPQLNYYLNSKLKAVNKDYTTHVMRHTHVSLLAEQELPLKYIMDRVGHNKPETTLRIYTHVTEKMQEKGQQVLDNLF